MATTAENKDEKGSIELPAPEGWAKKQIPKKSGSGTSRRNEIVFIAPTGETIKSKKQLDQYLKSHPGGPPSSEFSWSTGETPRRSRRISEKSKLSETESPETQPSLKKRKTSGSKQEENDNADEEEEVVEGKDETSAGQETEAIKDVEMKEVDAGDATKVSTEDAAAAVVSKEDGSIEDAVTATSVDNSTEPKAEEKDVGADEMNLEITENQTTDNKTTDDEKEQVANDPPTAEELQEEAEKEKELEAPSDLSEKVEAVPVYEAPEPVSEAPEPVTEAPLSEAPVLEDVKEIAEKQPVEGEDRKDTEPIEKADKDVNEAVFEAAAGEMEEKELEEKTGDKKVPALNFASEEETKVTDENSNYSVNLEEKTPQEPKAPQVS